MSTAILENNLGFKRLRSIGFRLCFSNLTATFMHWVEHRWPQAYGELNALCETGNVNIFIDGYASELADSLQRLDDANELEDIDETTIDYIEELVSQAREFKRIEGEK